MATMRDVAAQAGVSYTTVSYVLNQRDSGRGIGEETRRRVTAAAQALGYRHNALARAMVEGGQRVIGLLIQDLSLEIRAQILAGVIEEANRSDYLVKVFPLTGQSVSEETLNKCLEQRLGGAIVVNVNTESLNRMQREFARYRMALAMVDDVSPQNWGVRVVSDDAAGVFLALQHLWDLGHRRFGFMAGPTNSAVTAIRRRAYADFMAEHSLESGPIIDSSPHWDLRETDKEQLRGALLKAQRPTAIFCVSDFLAMRVLRLARSLGLEVPRDLSVVGYSDLTVAGYADPPLTTIAQPFRAMGELATRHVVERLAAARSQSEQEQDAATKIFNEPLDVALPTQLVIRHSTAAPFMA